MENSNKFIVEGGKASHYQSDYIESSDPGSYEDTSEGSDVDHAKRHSSKSSHYDPNFNMSLDDFYLDLRFGDLKQFKNELVAFSTRKGFEFIFLKNDAVMFS